MRVHSETKINQIKEMRRSGYSIGEIALALSVPKTTVWHHIKNVTMEEPLKAILSSKRGGSALRSQKEWQEAEILAKQILSGSHSKLAIAAAMLYWGEGGKKTCDIINTDPKLIQLYLKFLYDVLGMTSEKIKLSIRTFTGMDQKECLKYWAGNLNLDPDRFIVRYNDGGVSGKAKYGMCRITLIKGKKVLKLMHSLIRLSFSDIMGFVNPVPLWIDYRRPGDIKKTKLLIVQRTEQDTPNV